MRLVRAVLAAAVVVLAAVPVALAQGPIQMTTAFPSVVADPGAAVTFPIRVTTDAPETVDLTVSQQPDGWNTVLRGGGSTIAALSTSPNPDAGGANTGDFTAEVSVPDDVAPGSNQIVIDGRTSGGTTASITLVIVTEQQEAGSVTLESEFPTLEGPATSSFPFKLTLSNDTNSQLTFAFETDSPAGWDVEARPQGETQAATAVVDAGGTADINVTVKPPADAPAGTTPITVRAVAGAFSAQADLSVELTGSYGMSLTTSDQRLNARVTAGGSTVLTLLVNNTGSAPITNLKFSATPPSGWKVDFSPATVDQVPAGDQGATTQATITASNDALAGDYLITIRADSDNPSDTVEIRTTVETSPIGYIVGIGVLVAVAIGLFVVFQRYGRR